MVADLRYGLGVDWYRLDSHERAEAATWWTAVRRRELAALGVFDEAGGVKLG